MGENRRQRRAIGITGRVVVVSVVAAKLATASADGCDPRRVGRLARS